MNLKYVGFGDLLVCLSTPGHCRFLQADRFEASYSGAEANTMVALAGMGCRTEHVTRLPENAIADAAEALLHKYGVSTEHTLRGGKRIGVLYLEQGASQRSSKVIYDREETSFSNSEPGSYPWASILEGAGWFHFTGITAALSDRMPVILEEAFSIAKSNKIPISCDLNYRSKLWSPDQAKRVMRNLASKVDVIIGNEEDAEIMLGIRAGRSQVEAGELDYAGYERAARQICEMYGVRQVAYSLRKSISASDNGMSGMLFDGTSACFSKEYQIHIVDRVGAGDAFAAGILYGISSGFSTQKTIDFAAATTCLKQTMEKDYCLASTSEIYNLMDGSGTGRIQR